MIVMKKDIHPTYFKEAPIKCACGETYSIGSTKPSIGIEVCSACHPVYTGKGRVLDTAGRVEKLKARVAAKKEVISKTQRKKASKEK